MIPRILVPIGARLPATNVATTRRRPSTLDERTLVPSNLPLVKLDGQSTIPTNLPLESIATRVVVPRDVNVEAVQRPEESHLPLQPTDMDERITVPQGAVPPEEFSPLPVVSEELIEPDILQTGEVAFLTPSRPSQGSFGDAITRVVSVAMHISWSCSWYSSRRSSGRTCVRRRKRISRGDKSRFFCRPVRWNR